VLGVHRPCPGGAVDRHRLAGSAAAGLRDRRRHAAVADLQPAGDPGVRACVHGEREAERTLGTRRCALISSDEAPSALHLDPAITGSTMHDACAASWWIVSVPI